MRLGDGRIFSGIPHPHLLDDYHPGISIGGTTRDTFTVEFVDVKYRQSTNLQDWLHLIAHSFAGSCGCRCENGWGGDVGVLD